MSQRVPADHGEAGANHASRSLLAGFRGFLVVIVLSGGLLLGLYAVSQDGESAGGPGLAPIPTPPLTASEACGVWAAYWMTDSGIGASAESLQGFSNCRLADDGEWFVPRGSADARLPAANRLDADAREATNALRFTILRQVDGLESHFTTAFARQMNRIYDPSARPVTGHLRDGEPFGSVRDRYDRLARAYLMAPANQELAAYVGWVMGRRAAAYEEFLTRCYESDLVYLRAACEGLRSSLSITWIPFPWDLTDSVTLDAYLASIAKQEREDSGPG